MAKNPLQTKLCDMLGIEFPIIAFTHCKDVVDAVVNAGGFAVLGEAMHTPEQIEADIKWIRSRVGDKPFGIDLVLPSSVPPTGDLDELKKRCRGYLGQLFELLKPMNKKYELAIKVAMAKQLKLLVVDTAESSKYVTEFLKEKGLPTPSWL